MKRKHIHLWSTPWCKASAPSLLGLAINLYRWIPGMAVKRVPSTAFPARKNTFAGHLLSSRRSILLRQYEAAFAPSVHSMTTPPRPFNSLKMPSTPASAKGRTAKWRRPWDCTSASSQTLSEATISTTRAVIVSPLRCFSNHTFTCGVCAMIVHSSCNSFGSTASSWGAEPVGRPSWLT
ncbi:hypothetical protein BDK51DRAFT_30466 [Blyttiomyces helicus]|uniref:Uncharacterized protein n=1 Tax=Blyttiomyces helicus TaxID=388810 RepID=A0A4P9W8U4_9FUNG|nr:hypothetical protein BDK51DRAFT_30466 [Blyttiomyces helicus]|eukprot:RKO87895.1 hypothetical protein BDK51DRAFT_30466 [Blyttiomyces helicus]